jgi:reactive intermediate/imine deaminase
MIEGAIADPVFRASDEDADLPFSESAQVGKLLFLSGQIGVLPGQRTVVSGGIKAETRQTMTNIAAALERAGSSLDEVVKCTIMLADIADWPAMNEVYVGFFQNHKPARSAFAGSGLALGARVEIECIAALQ